MYEHVVEGWQVLAPPVMDSLHTVVSVRDSQSAFDMQYTDDKLLK